MTNITYDDYKINVAEYSENEHFTNWDELESKISKLIKVDYYDYFIEPNQDYVHMMLNELKKRYNIDTVIEYDRNALKYYRIIKFRFFNSHKKLLHQFTICVDC